MTLRDEETATQSIEKRERHWKRLDFLCQNDSSMECENEPEVQSIESLIVVRKQASWQNIQWHILLY